MPPASMGGSPRSASRSDPGSSEITASALVPRACDILCVSFESGLFIFLRPLALVKVRPHWPSKPNVLGAHLPSAGPLGWGAQCGAWTPCSLWRTSTIVTILPFMDRQPQDMGLDYTVSPPLLPILLWFCLYIFSYRRSLPIVFRSFLSTVAL